MDNDIPRFRSSVFLRPNSEAVDLLYSPLTSRIIACAISVHKQLGPGFLEKIYEEAFVIALKREQLPFVRQIPVRIFFEGEAVGHHRLDLIIDQKIVVELKAVQEVCDIHLATCLSYLKATGLHVGLIVNFAEAKIRVKRVVRKVGF